MNKPTIDITYNEKRSKETSWPIVTLSFSDQDASVVKEFKTFFKRHCPKLGKILAPVINDESSQQEGKTVLKFNPSLDQQLEQSVHYDKETRSLYIDINLSRAGGAGATHKIYNELLEKVSLEFPGGRLMQRSDYNYNIGRDKIKATCEEAWKKYHKLPSASSSTSGMWKQPQSTQHDNTGQSQQYRKNEL